jgi:fibronectin type 3 domain-containing protein
LRKAIAVLIVLLTIGATMPAHANTPGKHTVSLTWTAPTSGCSAGCTYDVYRATAAGACSGNPTPYATGITSTAYTDQNPALGATYFYDVSAVGSGGESACSNELQVQVPTPPGAPSGLSGAVQ